MKMTRKEARFARQLFLAGCALFVLSWFQIVSPIVGRIALAIGIFGGAIARGIDSPPDQLRDETVV